MSRKLEPVAETVPQTQSGAATGPLLHATGLRAGYGPVTAVDDVSLTVERGEVLGIAGESGCGKSTLAAVLSLTARPPLEVAAGRLTVDGQDIPLTGRRNRSWRGTVVSLLPQGAMNSLSPTRRIRDFAYDVIHAHQPKTNRQQAIELTRERLQRLDLPPRVLDHYPHQLSGGMKQRVVTVLSTLLDPQLLIADEPTSALDVSSQHTMIEMLRAMVETKIIRSVIFVTHDLPVLASVADRIAIMYAGQIVELGDTREIIDQPHHPYSGALLKSVLVPEPEVRGHRILGIGGMPPSLAAPPAGCRFHPRCPLVMDVCRHETPPLVGGTHRFATCWWAKDHPDTPVEL